MFRQIQEPLMSRLENIYNEIRWYCLAVHRAKLLDCMRIWEKNTRTCIRSKLCAMVFPVKNCLIGIEHGLQKN